MGIKIKKNNKCNTAKIKNIRYLVCWLVGNALFYFTFVLFWFTQFLRQTAIQITAFYLCKIGEIICKLKLSSLFFLFLYPLQLSVVINGKTVLNYNCHDIDRFSKTLKSLFPVFFICPWSWYKKQVFNSFRVASLR